MSSADKQVIDMVNAPWERRRLLQERSIAAKRERQRMARERSRRADVINSALWLALKVELVILAIAVGFIVVAG